VEKASTGGRRVRNEGLLSDCLGVYRIFEGVKDLSIVERQLSVPRPRTGEGGRGRKGRRRRRKERKKGEERKTYL